MINAIHALAYWKKLKVGLTRKKGANQVWLKLARMLRSLEGKRLVS